MHYTSTFHSPCDLFQIQPLKTSNPYILCDIIYYKADGDKSHCFAVKISAFMFRKARSVLSLSSYNICFITLKKNAQLKKGFYPINILFFVVFDR